MARIAGVDIPREKRLEISLTYIFGIGKSTAQKIAASLELDPNTKVRDLTEDEVTKIRAYVDDVQTCAEETIVEAMRFTWDRMKIIIEPSGAVPFAMLLERRIDVSGLKVGVVISGGNVDLDRLPWQ